jgi:transposase
MAVLVVSEMELSRLDTLQRIVERRLTCTAAAKLLGLSRRQVHRLVTAYRAQGAAALVSKRRGQPSNRRYPAAWRDQVLGLVRERYHDFGPTLAAEKLAEHHDLRVSHETLRQWMIQDGLWLTRPERKKRIHQPRQRRDRRARSTTSAPHAPTSRRTASLWPSTATGTASSASTARAPWVVTA